MIFVAGRTFSQTYPVSPVNIRRLSTHSMTPGFTTEKKLSFFPVTQVIASNFYVAHLGIFCKQEIKFEKATRIPLRFRFGNIEDCDRLEGKDRKIEH